MADADRRETLLCDVFEVLDQKKRGFISRVELAHILDAMQADASVDFEVPEALKPDGVTKDSRVTMTDLRKFLAALGIADLEDLKWFAESVVKVESELREVWKAAVQRWRDKVESLYKRNLHRYLLSSQPERVARWLLLRTSMDEVNKDDSSIGLLGLGISQQEVEVLFTDETADDINRCSETIEPFLDALALRDSLAEQCLEGDLTCKCPPEVDSKVTELLTKLSEFAERGRELACLLIHEDSLSFATNIIRSLSFSQAVVGEGSKLIMTLINYRVDENARDYEKWCRQLVVEYLEIDFDTSSFDLDAENQQLNEQNKKARQTLKAADNRQRATVAEWVASLLTLRIDFDRGEMLDVLIKYDEKRLLLDSDGGDRKDENAPVPVSLFSYGRTVPYFLGRLFVSSHHSMHEHRTPMRTHIWKLLLNVLSSAGERGRQLFRAGRGMQVICNVIRGSAWGVEREEVTLEEEEDREEEEALYRGAQGGWGLRDPYHTWPYTEVFEGSQTEHRYYTMDFLDDKFYGSKDRMLAAAFLEYMSSDTMWGEEKLVEEMMQYPNTLQVFCRVRPPSCFLMRLLLCSPHFPGYIRSDAEHIAKAHAEQVFGSLLLPDSTCHSLFPTCYNFRDAEKEAAMRAFQDHFVQVEARNIVLYILSHAYHSLQACLQEERSMREGEAASRTEKRTDADEPLDEATQLEEEITECCKLIAQQLPLTLEEISEVAVAIYMQVKDFTRKALLAVNQLPPVNPDERQRARGLEVAKTVPPRPMYFGHYQQLIYNQSNPTQPSSRAMVFEYQARFKCLQGAAETLFTGENRYLSEPSLFPYEFLVVLRLVQLIRLREPQIPPFISELQDLLDQLTGQRSSFIFSDTREDIELAGAEYPWRTGLAQLNTFRISQVPLRRSELKRYPRERPLDVVAGLMRILKEYAELNMWEEESPDDNRSTVRAKDNAYLEALAVRRSILLALVFNHLCYFHPKMVTLEDSPTGLAFRLGVTIEMLSASEAILADPLVQDLLQRQEFDSTSWPENCVTFQSAPGTNTIVVLQVGMEKTEGEQAESPKMVTENGESKLAFVCMNGIWTLWANCCKDNAQVLTECSTVQKYFAFDAAAPKE